MTTRHVVELVREAADLGLPIDLSRPEAAAVAEYIARLEAAAQRPPGPGRSPPVTHEDRRKPSIGSGPTPRARNDPRPGNNPPAGAS